MKKENWLKEEPRESKIKIKDLEKIEPKKCDWGESWPVVTSAPPVTKEDIFEVEK